MLLNDTNTSNAKPFLKWAGGKTQLLKDIDNRLPTDINDITTYIEPFIGGGSVFFHLSMNQSFNNSYICDANEELVISYSVIKKSVKKLVENLETLSLDYLSKDIKAREIFYYDVRESFNNNIIGFDYKKYNNEWVYRTAQIIFLNHTCFNGLFRVNRKGEFNVPFGSYDKPIICDKSNLYNISKLLKNTDIISGDFTKCDRYIDDHTLIYMDPPYRPINKTSAFTSYSKMGFTDTDQLRVVDFFKVADEKGAKIILSNSDPKNENIDDTFFDDLFSKYHIERVPAKRMINCNGKNRGNINELIITNY